MEEQKSTTKETAPSQSDLEQGVMPEIYHIAVKSEKDLQVIKDTGLIDMTSLICEYDSYEYPACLTINGNVASWDIAGKRYSMKSWLKAMKA